MSCDKKSLECKDCDCDKKETTFEKCCPKDCRCMGKEEYQKLEQDHDSSPPKGYSYKKDASFVKKLCKAQYMTSKESYTVKNADGSKSTSKCKLTRNACQKKSKCFLVPYSEQKQKCCLGQTGHHILPGSMFASKTEREDGTGGGAFYSAADHKKAPTVCVAGGSHSIGTHGLMHYATKKEFNPSDTSKMTFDQASNSSLAAHKKVFKKSNCDYECMKKKLNDSYTDDNKKGSYNRKDYGCAAKEGEDSIENLKEINDEIGKKLGTDVNLFD